jgi:hypothetical protein
MNDMYRYTEIWRITEPASFLQAIASGLSVADKNKQTKQTPWPLVHERTILTERPPLVDEI